MPRRLAALKTSEPLFRVLRNAGSLLAGSAAGEVLTTSAVGLAAVSLGAAGFGQLATAQAFVEPFQSVAGFGLSSVAVMVAAQRGGVDAALRGTLVGLCAVFSLSAIILVYVADSVTRRGGPPELLAVATGAMIFGPMSLAAVLPFHFAQDMHRVVAIPFLVSIVRISTAYGAYLFLRRPVGFQMSSACASALSTGLMYWSARRYTHEGFRFDATLARKLVALAWPAAVLEFVVMAYMRGSYFLLHEAGPVVQGEYAAADRLVRPVLALSGALTVSALPTVAKIAAAGEFARLKTLYTRTITRCLAVVLPVALVAGWFVPPLLARYAPGYAAATTPFRVLLGGVVFMFLNQLSSTFIIAMGRFRLIMTVALVNFVVYLVLAKLLIPRFGATGAAVATAMMENINTIMQIVIVYMLLRSAASTAPRRHVDA